MTFLKHRAWIAAIAIVAALLDAGCKRKTRLRTIERQETTQSDLFTTDDFPGSGVQSNNVADDKRAFSVTDEDPDMASVRCIFNGDRGAAIVTYTTGGSAGLYAHHYDGGTWTPPVALRSQDVNNPTVAPLTLSVCFINTEDSGDDDARERAGDAIILWTASDFAGATAADGTNRTLRMTYFDASNHDSIADRFGFQEFAARIDAQDEAGENVQIVAVVSDGLCGEARWTFIGNDYRWGDDVTAIEVYFVQGENNDGVAGSDDLALYSVRIDPAQDLDDDLPLTAQRLTRHSIIDFGASDSGTSSEETLVDVLTMISYNAMLLFRVHALNTTGGDDFPTPFPVYGDPGFNGQETAIEGIPVNLETGVIGTTFHLLPSTPVATDSNESASSFLFHDSAGFFGVNSVYGSDEGLSELYVVYVESQGATLDTGFTDPTNDGRLCVAQLTESDGTGLEIRFVDVEDATILDPVMPERVTTRMSRNGDYFWMFWQEAHDVGATPDLNFWAAELQTTRIDDEGEFPVADTLVNTVSAPTALFADNDGVNYTNLQIQQALGYICGIQSNPDVMNVFTVVTVGASQTIVQARVTADVDTIPPGCVPTYSVTTLEVVQPGSIATPTRFNASRTDFVAADNGDDGNVIVFYREDIDTTAGVDGRLMSESAGETSGKLEVGSRDSFRQVPSQGLNLFATPAGSEIGSFDSENDEDDEDRSHGANLVHIVFLEDSSTLDSTNGDDLRTRVFDVDAADTDTFGEHFRPNADTSEFERPFGLGLPNLDTFTADQPTVFGTAVSGNTIAIWFTQNEHIYFQAFEGEDADGEWYTNDDVSDPKLVDDDTSFELPAAPLFFARTCSCDTLEGATTFWTKETDGFSGRRLFVRQLDGDD